MKVEFSARESISKAIDLTKNCWYILAVFPILIYAVQQLCNVAMLTPLTDMLQGQKDPHVFLTAFKSEWSSVLSFWVVSTALAAALSLGLVRSALDVIDGKSPSLKALSQPLDVYVQLILCSWLVSAIYTFGGLCCIVPGVYLFVRLILSPYFVVDKGMNCLDAMSASWSATQDNWWHLFGAGILLWLFSMCGVLLCFVGYLYTMPVGVVAWVLVYRRFADSQREGVPVE